MENHWLIMVKHESTTAGWGPSSLAKLVQRTIITIVNDTNIVVFRVKKQLGTIWWEYFNDDFTQGLWKINGT